MIGIIGAMEDEVKLLRSQLKGAESETRGCFTFLLGELEGKKAVLLQSGIGKVAAAAGCTLMIERYKPALLINTGSAGGMCKDQSLGDVVVASALFYHDVDVTAFGYAPGQLPGQNQTFPIDEKLCAAAEKAVDELKANGVLPKHLSHRRGFIGSGDVFMSTDEQAERKRAVFPSIAAIDMESAAIAHTCAMFGVSVLVIRALSDIAGTESLMTFDEFLPLASLHSAEIVRRIIANL